MTEPTRARRHAGSPARARGLLILVTVCVLGMIPVGLSLTAFASNRWMRVVGQLIVFLASLQLVPLYFIWRSWRQQAGGPDRRSVERT